MLFTKKTKRPDARHIDEFRTEDYRVFTAAPYFKLDLHYEIGWNKKHVEKLREQSKKPHLFHRERYSGPVDEHRERHFQEHVIESIPFHEKILSDHQARLATILSIMPDRNYKKLVAITKKQNTVPEYFVFDKKAKEYFFVAERNTESLTRWKKESRKYCDLILLSK